MTEVKLTEEEAEALRVILSCLVLRDRTGELGMLYGADRFVSTHRTFRKPERAAVQSLAKKAGLGSGLALYRA
jgi:hypothetical protein